VIVFAFTHRTGSFASPVRNGLSNGVNSSSGIEMLVASTTLLPELDWPVRRCSQFFSAAMKSDSLASSGGIHRQWLYGMSQTPVPSAKQFRQ
jgi:hypothetical protein